MLIFWFQNIPFRLKPVLPFFCPYPYRPLRAELDRLALHGNYIIVIGLRRITLKYSLISDGDYPELLECKTADPHRILEFLDGILKTSIEEYEYNSLRDVAFRHGTPHCQCLLGTAYTFSGVDNSYCPTVYEGNYATDFTIPLIPAILNMEIACLIHLRGSNVLEYHNTFFQVLTHHPFLEFARWMRIHILLAILLCNLFLPLLLLLLNLLLIPLLWTFFRLSLLPFSLLRLVSNYCRILHFVNFVNQLT